MSQPIAWPLLVFLTVVTSWFNGCLVYGDEKAATPPPATAAEGSPATYKLQYKYKEGNDVRYETVHNVKFVSQFKGTDETATNRTETRKRYTVAKTNPDGTAELVLIIDWVRMKVNFGDGDPGVEFDSKDPSAKTQAKFRNVFSIIGRPQARLLCAPSGKVLKFVLAKSTVEGNSREVHLKEVAGQDDFSFLTIFPETPIKIGETWSEKSETKVNVDNNLQQTIELKRTYKLDSVDGKVANITFKTAILTPVNNPQIAIQLIQRETSGKIVFDMEGGAVVTRTVDTDKTIIKPIGDNTAMQSVSHLFERLITETAEVSNAPAETIQKQ